MCSNGGAIIEQLIWRRRVPSVWQKPTFVKRVMLKQNKRGGKLFCDNYYSDERFSPCSMAGRVILRAPPPPPFEPFSPSVRSDISGYATTPSFTPLKAFTAPGHVSPPHPPPTVVGRPPLRFARKCHRHGCGRCLDIFFLVTAVLITAVFVAALVFGLVYEMEFPHCTLQDVRIVQLNVTTSRHGNSIIVRQQQPSISNQIVLNSHILFTVQARNPNHKIGMSYRQISISGMYKGTSVGQCNVHGFYQGVDNTTTLRADLIVRNAQLTDGEGIALQTDIKRSNIALLGRIDLKLGIKIGSWTSPHVWIYVHCNIRVSPPSSLQGAKLLRKVCRRKWK